MANYSYILQLLKNSTAKLKATDPRRVVYNNLTALNGQILNLNRQGPANGAPDGPLMPHKMTEQEFDTLMESYETLKTSIAQANKSKAKDINQQFLDEIMQLVNRDLEALHRADRRNLSDYHSMVNDSAHYTADIRGKNLDRIGGSSSSRFSMSVADGKGGYIDGYFTADSRLIPDVCLKEAYQNAILGCQDNPQLCAALKDIKGKYKTLNNAAMWLFNNTQFNDSGQKEILKYCPGAANGNNAKLRKELSHQWSEMLGIKPHIKISEDQLKSLYTMVSQIHSIGFSRGFMKHSARVAHGGVIGQRNAAMSAVADYLGVPNLIARSNQISVLVGTKNGKPVYKNGTFMEKVNGLQPGELANKIFPAVKESDTENLAMKKDASNLQVLDYICGNVDRHSGNYFIKHEIKDGKLTFTGLVGIDNDAAFGEIALYEDEHCLRTPPHMGYITKDMADRVSKITKADLQQLLSGFGLRSREINAAWERVQYLKEYIAENKKDFVKDDKALESATLRQLNIANKRETKDSRLNGIGTTCFIASNNIAKVYEKAQDYYKPRLEEYIKKYETEHEADRQPDGKITIPPEEMQNLENMAHYVACCQAKEELKLFLPENKDLLESYMSRALEQINEEHNWKLDMNHLGEQKEIVQKKAVEIITQEFKPMYELDYDNYKNDIAKNIAHKQKKAEEAENQKVERLSGRAARLAEVQNMLKDVRNAFVPTLKNHGMTGDCTRMYDSMNELLEMTKELKNTEAAQPDQYNAQKWEAFQAKLKETLDNTCFYISKKPYSPIHQYGKDRLDAAHELRTCAINALQMADDEMLAAQPQREEPQAVNVQENNADRTNVQVRV